VRDEPDTSLPELWPVTFPAMSLIAPLGLSAATFMYYAVHVKCFSFKEAE
jgi:hypothetical protein